MTCFVCPSRHRRNELPGSVPSSNLDAWRTAPRRMSCSGCGYEVRYTTQDTVMTTIQRESEEEAVVMDERRRRQTGGENVLVCPRCSSKVRFMDLSKTNPGPVDWTEVSLLIEKIVADRPYVDKTNILVCLSNRSCTGTSMMSQNVVPEVP